MRMTRFSFPQNYLMNQSASHIKRFGRIELMTKLNFSKLIKIAFEKLTKKEKTDLEMKNKKMFEQFTNEYDDKTQNYMYQIMPQKIKELNDVFQVENSLESL